MYSYDYRISLGVQHPEVSSADISARLGLERGFFRDIGTDLLDGDGHLIRVHGFTRVSFELAAGKDGWLMDAWPLVVEMLQARVEVIHALNQEGADVRLRIAVFGKQAWAGYELDDTLVRLMADLRLGFHVETYFPDPPADPGTDDDA
ncbi:MULTISPECIES: hypothetical protein [Stenotrophomonas]|jgi:hypothetical protein|uniref:hypothetical protein n=1 Tax=Stenotrophomonas TaxID=40323 RepID=UPI00201D1B1E|nr:MULTISPECIES: hypothetical protein [Stenotrophomonas]MBN5025593.1 hypothetical protein [Stenotrophomonas maltophilia]MDH1273997.1 hypothetical protein [Stenotrophomonas sp. GD03937]MDH1484813.1 hypothetical protein [Stenotrophomonas sp. GD03712]UQY94630.1 hypothetical protein LZ605_16065 [Stenotrophomonas maltophilia]WON68671.1 hypothetical protein RWT08_21105 [Stenotrophomonas maltophilia]